ISEEPWHRAQAAPITVRWTLARSKQWPRKTNGYGRRYKKSQTMVAGIQPRTHSTIYRRSPEMPSLLGEHEWQNKKPPNRGGFLRGGGRWVVTSALPVAAAIHPPFR